MSNKIIIIGFMGAGKSTIGAGLADELKLPFLDLDEIILESSAYASVNQAFETDGEELFRSYENTALQNILMEEAFVLATGGGVIESEENRKLISNKDSLVIYLDVSFEVVSIRLQNDDSRPLFKSLDSAYEIYCKRKELYSSVADTCIPVDDKTPAEVIRAVLEKLSQ